MSHRHRSRTIGVAAGLALSLASAGTVVTVHAGTVACYYPAATWEQSGDTFDDGDTPSTTVNLNECTGGPPGGPYDNHVYDQYQYNAAVSQSEYDVQGFARRWVCGQEQTPASGDSTNAWSYTSPWADYGVYNGSQCGIQFDWTVKFTSNDGGSWQSYTNEDSQWSCNGDFTSRCPGS
jgi:hypothetical protein